MNVSKSILRLFCTLELALFPAGDGKFKFIGTMGDPNLPKRGMRGSLSLCGKVESNEGRPKAITLAIIGIIGILVLDLVPRCRSWANE
jgi:hypothetical protein